MRAAAPFRRRDRRHIETVRRKTGPRDYANSSLTARQVPPNRRGVGPRLGVGDRGARDTSTDSCLNGVPGQVSTLYRARASTKPASRLASCGEGSDTSPISGLRLAQVGFRPQIGDTSRRASIAGRAPDRGWAPIAVGHRSRRCSRAPSGAGEQASPDRLPRQPSAVTRAYAAATRTMIAPNRIWRTDSG
jgi:hypothetical protein